MARTERCETCRFWGGPFPCRNVEPLYDDHLAATGIRYFFIKKGNCCHD